MGNINRFTVPAVDRVMISDGDWIEVKRDLNVGEVKKMESAGQSPTPVMLAGVPINPIDWERYEFERAAIYLVDWSLRDAKDKPVTLKDKEGNIDLSKLRALSPDSFKEISDAIMKHAVDRSRQRAQEAEAEKKLRRVADQPTGDQPSVSETTLQ